jgi:hypothetical protein
MREAVALTNGQRSPDVPAGAARRSDRRHGRQVALARCSPYAAPCLATWIAVASLSSASVLLVAKRPQGAWAALGDFASLLSPSRPIAARWCARGIRRVRRRDLRGLFASPKAGFSHALDAIHEAGPVGHARSGGSALARGDLERARIGGFPPTHLRVHSEGESAPGDALLRDKQTGLTTSMTRVKGANGKFVES